MTKTEERIRQATSDLHRALGDVEPPEIFDPGRHHRGWARALMAAAVVVAALVFVAPPTGVEDPSDVVGPPSTSGTTSTITTLPPTTTSQSTTAPSSTVTTLAPLLPADGPIFGTQTDVILLLDDGIDGVLAIDPDRRVAARSVVEGQRAGDEPYSMVRVGDSLVVGWSEIFAVDIETRAPTSLGFATIFVPAAEPGRVWMIDWPGGAIGSGTPQVWQVTTSGEQVTEPVLLDVGGFPAIGIAGGLAIEHDQGIVLWDAVTGETRILEADGHGFVLGSAGDELVWCPDPCRELVLTDTGSLESQRFAAPDEGAFEVKVGSFRGPAAVSPDGRRLAALVRGADPDAGVSLWLLDRQTGVITLVVADVAAGDYVAWSPDGGQLFATGFSYGQTRTVMWRYEVDGGNLAQVVLPFGGGLTPVIVDDVFAHAWLGTGSIGTEDCPRPSVQPSGRIGICAFDF